MLPTLFPGLDRSFLELDREMSGRENRERWVGPADEKEDGFSERLL